MDSSLSEWKGPIFDNYIPFNAKVSTLETNQMLFNVPYQLHMDIYLMQVGDWINVEFQIGMFLYNQHSYGAMLWLVDSQVVQE